MNLISLPAATSLYNSNAISVRIAEALARPAARLASDVESTRVQLSALGQVKSSTAQLENAAQTLRDNKKITSVDGLSKAVLGFASAVNSRLAAVDRANAGNTTPAVRMGTTAASNNSNVRAADLEMRRTLDGVAGNNRQALKQMGISLASNGGLSVDTQALQNAFASNPEKVRQTLETVGAAVSTQSAQQLSEKGTVTSALSKLTEKLVNVERRQSDNSSRVELAQRSQLDQENRLAQAQGVTQQAFIFTGIAAYNRVFSS
jgi:hypothetical protein